MGYWLVHIDVPPIGLQTPSMKEEILVEVTMVVVETIMTLEIIVDSNNQIMDP